MQFLNANDRLLIFAFGPTAVDILSQNTPSLLKVALPPRPLHASLISLSGLNGIFDLDNEIIFLLLTFV